MRNYVCLVVLSLVLVGLAQSRSALAQADSTLYFQVDCMKSQSPDYTAVESEIWKPIHAELVNQGRKVSWAFYWVWFGDRSECDYFTVNAYRGSKALEDDLSDLEAVYNKVHPAGAFDEDMDRTWTSREMVWSELWTYVDGVAPNEFKYVRINQMSTDSAAAYVALEREVYKPVHAALVKDGKTAGWGVYSLAAPWGTSGAYNFGTADFLKDMAGFQFNDYVQKVHPNANIQEINRKTTEVRDLVAGSIWMLVDSTF